MGGLIASGICCCFSCCCQQCSDALKKWLGPQRSTKLFYFLLVIIFTVPTIVIFFFLNRWQAFVTYFKDILACPDITSSQSAFNCIGSSVVYRLSICLLILFFCLLLVMLCRSRCSMVINEGLFCFKYLFVLILFIAAFWVPGQVFNIYAKISLYASIIFCIFQSIILIDLFYLVGIHLVKKYDEGQNQYCCFIVSLTLIIYGGAITLNVLGYIFFPEQNCGPYNTLWLNIVISAIIVGLPFLQFLNFNKQNSLLTTSLISLYISYLSLASQYSYHICIRMTTQSFIFDIIVSSFFFFLTMYGSIMGGTGQIKVTSNGNVNAAIGVGSQIRQETQQQFKEQPKIDNNEDINNQNKYTQSWGWVKWHLYMCFACMYISILLTNWNSTNTISGEFSPEPLGFWVRVGLALFTVVLYIWTLIAPKVCPQRDFVVE